MSESYNIKYILKRSLLSFKEEQLELVGSRMFEVKSKSKVNPGKRIKEKLERFIKRKNKESDTALGYTLNLVDEDDNSSIIVVDKKEYDLATEGSSYGPCLLLKNKNKDFYFISFETKKEKAIENITEKSKSNLYMMLMALVISFLLAIIMFFIFIIIFN